LSDISIDRNSRPILVKYADGEGLNLAERDGLEAARPFKAKVKATDTGEQG